MIKSNVFQKNITLNIDEEPEFVLFLSRIEMYFQIDMKMFLVRIQYNNTTNANTVFTLRGPACFIQTCQKLQTQYSHFFVHCNGKMCFLSLELLTSLDPTRSLISTKNNLQTNTEEILQLTQLPQ